MRPFVFLWAAFLTTLSFAQDRQVTGQIRDENGAGMPGVNILLKGTNRGTNSNADGNFSVAVPAGAST